MIVLTTRSIATQCGNFTKGGIIMEGPVFRRLNQQDRMEIIPRLQVLVRSSPEDKKILVETLKRIGEIVSVMVMVQTTDLRLGLPMLDSPLSGAEVAKEALTLFLWMTISRPSSKQLCGVVVSTMPYVIFFTVPNFYQCHPRCHHHRFCSSFIG
jgi:hypothetical protein